MPRHILLSDGRRHAIETAHFDLDQRDIARYWTLSANELLGIQRRRRDANRFGFAVQLCLLRFPGWPAKKDSPVPVSLLRYVGEQLGIESADIEDYLVGGKDSCLCGAPHNPSNGSLSTISI